MAKRRKVGNLLALALLALLATGRAMHPYEMAHLLRRTGQERDMTTFCSRAICTVIEAGLSSAA